MTLSTLVAIAALAVTTSALTIGTLIARRQPTPADQLAAMRSDRDDDVALAEEARYTLTDEDDAA